MKTGMMLAVLLAVFGNASAMAEDAKAPEKKGPAFSKEMREQMAGHHEKMAVCLRSDRSIQECREEMREACRGQMGKEGCPMGEMWGGRGMRRGGPKKD